MPLSMLRRINHWGSKREPSYCGNIVIDREMNHPGVRLYVDGFSYERHVAFSTENDKWSTAPKYGQIHCSACADDENNTAECFADSNAHLITNALNVPKALPELAANPGRTTSPLTLCTPKVSRRCQNSSRIGSASIRRMGRLPGPGIMVVSRSMPIAR